MSSIRSNDRCLPVGYRRDETYTSCNGVDGAAPAIVAESRIYYNHGGQTKFILLCSLFGGLTLTLRWSSVGASSSGKFPGSVLPPRVLFLHTDLHLVSVEHLRAFG